MSGSMEFPTRALAIKRGLAYSAAIDVLREARANIASRTIFHMGKGDVPMFPELLAKIDEQLAKADTL